jgi:kynurenine formamidase
VSARGIDTLSSNRPEDGFKVHRTFLGADKIMVENIVNLANMLLAGGFCLVLHIIKLKMAQKHQ